MKKFLTRLLKRKFVKNVIIVASGTAIAQVIAFIMLPIVTRLYGPESYGLMGTFIAIVGVIIPVAALTYPIAIVLPKSDEEAKGIINLSLVITLTISVVSLIILLIFHRPIASLINAEEISSYLFLIPLVILTAGYVQIVKQWLIRKNEFKIVSKVSVFQPILSNSGMIIIGLIYPAASVLIIISSLKQGLTAMLMRISIKNKTNNFKTIKSNNQLKSIAKKYIDFPLYRSPEVLISGVSQNMPILFLTSFFGPAMAGFFTLCRSVLIQPISLIGNSVSEVFYPRISNAFNRNENLSNILLKATLVLAAVGIVPFGLIIMIGPWVFSLVFGAEWALAGEFARWLSLEYYFMLSSRPAIKTLPVLSAQRFHLFFSIVMLIIKASAFFIGYFFYDSVIVSIVLMSISGGTMYLLLILYTLSICNKPR